MTNRKIILFCVVSLIAIGVLLAGRRDETGPAGDADGVMRETTVPAAVSGDTVITSVSGAAAGGTGTQAAPAGAGNESEMNEGYTDGKKDDRKADDETDPPDSDTEADYYANSKGKAAKKKNPDLSEPKANKPSVKRTGKKSSTAHEPAKGQAPQEGSAAAGQVKGENSVSGGTEGGDSASIPAATEPPRNAKRECFLQVSCKDVWSHADMLKDNMKKVLPADGMIIQGDFAFDEGDTAFDVLKRACEEKGVLIDYVYTPGFSTYYIKGIQHLYEFDCGDESGWMYEVNGRNPDVGCSRYKLAAGDRVSFYYTVKRSGA